MISFSILCDECGKPATVGYFFQVSRVYVDGMDRGQDAHFCADHAPPESSIGTPRFAPRNCKRVQFHYSACVSPGYERDSYKTPLNDPAPISEVYSRLGWVDEMKLKPQP